MGNIWDIHIRLTDRERTRINKTKYSSVAKSALCDWAPEVTQQHSACLLPAVSWGCPQPPSSQERGLSPTCELEEHQIIGRRVLNPLQAVTMDSSNSSPRNSVYRSKPSCAWKTNVKNAHFSSAFHDLSHSLSVPPIHQEALLKPRLLRVSNSRGRGGKGWGFAFLESF